MNRLESFGACCCPSCIVHDLAGVVTLLDAGHLQIAKRAMIRIARKNASFYEIEPADLPCEWLNEREREYEDWARRSDSSGA